jgi:hypothetical protein
MIYNSSSNRCSRQRRRLIICAITLAILEEEQAELDITHRGRLLGAKHIRRTRKSIEEMFRQLGQRAVRAFKSSMDELSRLHSILEPHLLDQFGSSNRGRPSGPIPTKLRLSAAIRFFCGAPVHDIQLTHGISSPSVYKSVYGVINAVNRCPELHFNSGGAEFPSHDEQREIAHGFL